jgi:hypothetical protein
LEKVIDYCTHHSENPTPEDKKKFEDPAPWDQDFVKVENQVLFDLILVRKEMF